VSGSYTEVRYEICKFCPEGRWCNMRDGVSVCPSKLNVPDLHSWSIGLRASSSNLLHFRQLFDAFGSSPIGIAICDRHLRFVMVNRRLAEINRIPCDDHPGKSVHDIVGGLAPVPFLNWRKAAPHMVATELKFRPSRVA
jgi:PAS domain-containing protein